MASFERHWQVGLGASVGGALVASWLGLCPPKLLPILVGIGWVGSIAPDVDSDSSRPLRLIFNGLAALLPPVLLWRIEWLHANAERALLFWALGAAVVHWPMRLFFKRFTRHRGVIHSVPAALIFGGLCFLLAYHEDAARPFMWAAGGVGTVGYLAHLALDELWAVDFNGAKIKKKRSFGTALSWLGASRLQTFCLYCTLAVTWWACWRLWGREPFVPRELVEAWGGLREGVEESGVLEPARWRGWWEGLVGE